MATETKPTPPARKSSKGKGLNDSPLKGRVTNGSGGNSPAKHKQTSGKWNVKLEGNAQLEEEVYRPEAFPVRVLLSMPDPVKGWIEDHHELGATIGKGVTAEVKKATSKSANGRGKKVVSAVKLHNSSTMTVGIETEIQILSSISHPNIMHFHDYYVDKGRGHVAMRLELMDGGELLDRIITKDHYSEGDARNIVITLAEALSYLHRRSIVHRFVFGGRRERAGGGEGRGGGGGERDRKRERERERERAQGAEGSGPPWKHLAR